MKQNQKPICLKRGEKITQDQPLYTMEITVKDNRTGEILVSQENSGDRFYHESRLKDTVISLDGNMVSIKARHQ